MKYDIFKMNIAKFVYLTLCGEGPSIFSNYFTYTHLVHAYATTSSTTISQSHYFDVGTEHPTYTLYIKHSNLSNYGKKMVRVVGPLIWNSLPPGIQTFKIHLKLFLVAKYVD